MGIDLTLNIKQRNKKQVKRKKKSNFSSSNRLTRFSKALLPLAELGEERRAACQLPHVPSASVLEVGSIRAARVPSTVNLGQATEAIPVLELFLFLAPDIPDGCRVVRSLLVAPPQQVLDINVNETEADGYDGTDPIAKGESQRNHNHCSANRNY